MKTMTYRNSFLGFTSLKQIKVESLSQARRLIENWNEGSKKWCNSIYAYELVGVE